MSEKQIFTLSQVAKSIRKTIEQRYTTSYWVKAEMHKLNLFSSGHAFPELVEKKEGKIIAQFSGVIWKTHLQRINQRFIQIIKEPIREGATFLLYVNVQFSETHGVSLNIIDIDPDYSLGELQRERNETLERLQKEGLINQNQSLPYPYLPKRVALISAETSKGLSDFMKIISHNKEGYLIDTFLFPSYMQGEVAIDSIIKQIEKINQLKEHFDLIAIVRGGGGEIGMSCYNNYQLCKSIALSALPIFTGIGHSTNFTVAEMIAFQNAITPTELAESLLSKFREKDTQIYQFQKAIIEKSLDKIVHSKELIHQTQRQIKQKGLFILEYNKRFQTRSTHDLAAHTRKILQQKQTELITTKSTIQQKSAQITDSNLQHLSQSKVQITQYTQHQIKLQNILVEQLESKINILDPINVLQRGYSIVRFNDKTIDKENLPQLSDSIQIETAKFILDSTVTKIKENER